MSKKVKETGENRALARNRRVFHDFFIEDTVEAGIVLEGSEVKSVRAGEVSVKECFVKIERGEVYVHNMHINPFEKTGSFVPDARRKRKLLLHKQEIRRLLAQVKEKGFTLVVTNVYLKKKHVKVEVGLAKGKKLYDKRDAIAKRDAKLDLERELQKRERF